jgi:hypothetical protein
MSDTNMWSTKWRGRKNAYILCNWLNGKMKKNFKMRTGVLFHPALWWDIPHKEPTVAQRNTN